MWWRGFELNLRSFKFEAMMSASILDDENGLHYSVSEHFCVAQQLSQSACDVTSRLSYFRAGGRISSTL